VPAKARAQRRPRRAAGRDADIAQDPFDLSRPERELDPDDKFPRALAKKFAGIELMVKHKRHYTALLLLSVCAAPTVNPLLRAAAAARHARGGAGGGRTLLRGTLRRTLQFSTSEVPPGSFRESLIHLRVKCGGLGIQYALDAARRAYFASWAACGAAIAARCPHLRGGHRRRVRDTSSGVAFCAAAQRRRRAGATGAATHAPFSA
jgi:hypothetical protein